jgi:hypothetical protein
MARSIPDIKFELHKVYKAYTDQLFLAGNISNILLDNSNISAAGGQVEGSLRSLLAVLLPERIKVTHGHIVDKSAQLSYQQDILIADSFHTRSLIETLDGTEFFPFESVFATGEVKKTWSFKNLESAIKAVKRNKEVLARETIPSNVLMTGSNFIQVPSQLSSNPYRNPLFTFSFSLAQEDSQSGLSKLAAVYKNRNEWRNLPNISVVLNKGIYVLLDTNRLKSNEMAIKLYPEYVTNEEACEWFFLQLEPEESLAYLVFILIQHINDTVLERASLLTYSKSLLDISLQNLNPISDYES